MFDKDCHHDCSQGYCPFAKDAHNANRYVCLKCGVERNIDNKFGSFWLLVLALFILYLLLAPNHQQKEPKQQQENFLEFTQPSDFGS
ncbi:hypothetical protein [Fischerella sp. JS2]|uniref:hypothetical protein n=1 Tax=Fischerella sp. JS2 TaxID=2597771 RepID=UPI0028EDE031|nr:hypothetical protein [Fischerella sp. JS2]